jgi:hypothetical protein
MAKENKYFIADDFGNVCFNGKTFKDDQTAFDFLLVTFPVIHNDDGTQDDREEELSSYWIKKI